MTIGALAMTLENFITPASRLAGTPSAEAESNTAAGEIGKVNGGMKPPGAVVVPQVVVGVGGSLAIRDRGSFGNVPDA